MCSVTALGTLNRKKKVQISTLFTMDAFSEATISDSSTGFIEDGTKNYIDINNRYM